ncbi:MAG: deoxynucleoside kinase [Bacteroidetes bacterium]|nr:deoxynucleoside kinase [Bacteroidota bacterium]
MSLFEEVPRPAPFTATDESSLAIPEHLQYIVIEGVIGVGKTSLTKLLAEKCDARMVLEQFEENPFLERFYADRDRWAFQTQLSFLASRFRQQQNLGGRDLFHKHVISDYTFDKDRIFARLNLNGDELALYETMFGIMQPTTPVPDLIVYLQASTDRLMDNIFRRGRSYEKSMDRSYIEGLSQAYNQYFFHYNLSPLLIVNSSNIDFVGNPNDFNELIRQIAQLRHPGTTYFNPSPTRLPLL